MAISEKKGDFLYALKGITAGLSMDYFLDVGDICSASINLSIADGVCDNFFKSQLRYR